MEQRSERGAPPLSRGEYARRVLVAVAIALGALLVLGLLWFGVTLLFALFAGILLAIFLRGLASFLTRWTKLPERASLAAVVLLLLGLLVGLGFLFAPSLARQGRELTQKLPQAVDQVTRMVEQTTAGNWIQDQLPETGDLPTGRLVGGLFGFFSSTLGFLANLGIILFLGLYFAISPAPYLRAVLMLVPIPKRDHAREVLSTIAHQLRWWLVGRFASMAVVGVLTTLGLWLIGLPLALLLGLVAGLLSFVPILGPVTSAVPAILVGLLQGPEMALWVVLVFTGVQVLESYLITPVIEHQAVSLPPVAIIMAQLIMGLVSGILGIALATPAAVTVVVLVKMLYVRDALGDPVQVRSH